MGSRIENLGDYNKVRLDLQAVGGNLEELYKEVGDTAVAKAAPKLLLEGGAIGVGIGVAIYKGIHFIKDRKLKIKNEPKLKRKFVETIKTESEKQNQREVKENPEN